MTWDASTLKGARRRLHQRWQAEEEARLERLAELRRAARQCARILVEQFGARRVLLFGSVASGRASRRSDIDLAVEGVEPQHYFEALGRLTDATPIGVDLVLLEEAPTSLVDRVAREGKPLHGE